MLNEFSFCGKSTAECSYYHDISDKYVAYVAPLAGIVDRDTNKPSLDNQNGFVYDTDPGPNEGLREDGVRKERTPEVRISTHTFTS